MRGAVSSAGRAPALQAGGHWFEPSTAHSARNRRARSLGRRPPRSARMSSSLYSRLSVPGAAATDHRRSANLDVVRAIAALMVLVAHAVVLSVGAGSAHLSRTAGDTVAFLSNGVWLFFALSGYLIAGPFLRALAEGRRQPPVRSYAIRRAARILPAYWVALAAVL